MSGAAIQKAATSVQDAFNRRIAPDLAKLKTATDGMEAAFFKQLLGIMRKSVHKVSIGDQTGSAIYEDMIDQTFADAAGKRGTLGLGQMLYKQMSGLLIDQERANQLREARQAASTTSQTSTQEPKL